MLIRTCALAFALACTSLAVADTFTVTTPAEFQAALTAAQANGQPDTITVEPGTYDVSGGTLTYTAVATENHSLTINGNDSDAVTLDGGAL